MRRVTLLCTLFVLFDLPDCAAEILVSHPVLADLPERAQLLDLLAPRGYPSYDSFIAAFEKDPERLYPSRFSESDPATPPEARKGSRGRATRPASSTSNRCSTPSAPS